MLKEFVKMTVAGAEVRVEATEGLSDEYIIKALLDFIEAEHKELLDVYVSDMKEFA